MSAAGGGMGGVGGHPRRRAREPWAWLPVRLRPREADAPGGHRQWLVETTVLVLVGLLLAVATVNDLVRQTHINHRLIADLRTWRSYTGHQYRNLSTETRTLGPPSLGREVVCGNTAPGPPKTEVQICLAVWGPVVNGRRTVHGGWYVPARTPDTPGVRYGCFGEAGRGRCAR